MSYHDKLIALCNMLPPYCRDYFSAISDYEIRTRTAYAGDLKVFFEWVLQQPDFCAYESIHNIPLEIFDKLTHRDIDMFMEYLEKYEFEGKIYTNSPQGKKRKLATLRSFCKYFYRIEKIHNDPTQKVLMPKPKEKEFLVLSEQEQKKLMSLAETGERKSDLQKKYHEKTQYRDVAILTLFLSTGLRVSELVGIDIYDIDFEEQRILVTRKGGKKEFVYFNNESLDALGNYLDFERNNLLKLDKRELELNDMPDGPLFVSLKHSRISVRMVEIIIKNYARYVLPPNVKATPHTLRKTFGTSLYAEYMDLALVQHALGHESPVTTAKFYAKYNPDYNKKLKDYHSTTDLQ